MNDLEEKINDYYLKFKIIYNKSNYPEWFKFYKDHNKKNYGERGFREDGGAKKAGHNLGHYSILYTPKKNLKKPLIVIVGTNSSWFCQTGDNKMERSLKRVKELELGISETKNSYIDDGNKFGLALYSKDPYKPKVFNNLNSTDLFINNTVGMNRLWLQSGSTSAKVKSAAIKKFSRESKITNKEDRLVRDSIEYYCTVWTREIIIDLIKPKLVLLMGEYAHGLLSEKNRSRDITIKHCLHPMAYPPKTGPDKGRKVQDIIYDQVKSGLEIAGLK